MERDAYLAQNGGRLQRVRAPETQNAQARLSSSLVVNLRNLHVTFCLRFSLGGEGPFRPSFLVLHDRGRRNGRRVSFHNLPASQLGKFISPNGDGPSLHFLPVLHTRVPMEAVPCTNCVGLVKTVRALEKDLAYYKGRCEALLDVFSTPRVNVDVLHTKPLKKKSKRVPNVAPAAKAPSRSSVDVPRSVPKIRKYALAHPDDCSWRLELTLDNHTYFLLSCTVCRFLFR